MFTEETVECSDIIFPASSFSTCKSSTKSISTAVLSHFLLNCPRNLRKMILDSYISNQVFWNKAHHSVCRCIRVAIHALLQHCRLEPSAIDNEALSLCLTLQIDH